VKLRVCLDTTVFSAYYDDRLTDRQRETEEFWTRLDEFETATSEVAWEELLQTPDPEQRTKLQNLLVGFVIHPVTMEMRELARSYIDTRVFTSVMFNDALHVAAAVLTRQDVLLSWNFKHLVNRRRRAKVSEVNISLGLPTIEIVAPPEL
jgi:predicted nucleic acid-binding protein